MTDKTVKLELFKIAATLTTVKFKDGDDLATVFADCYSVALAEFDKKPDNSGKVQQFPIPGSPRTF